MRRRFRRAWSEDPQLLPRVFELLDLCFPGAGLPAKERVARSLGARWDEISTPFALFENGRLVSHVGVLEHRLVVNGRPLRVGGIHAVATHPEQRRRGHGRAVLEEALAWCDERWDALELSTAEPRLYEPFGFRELRESRFVGAVRRAPGRDGLCPLDRADARDLERLRGLLAEREPVSQRLGVAEPGPVFLFVTANAPLWRVPALEAVVSLALERGTLRLYDVVARSLPTLEALLAEIPQALARVEVYFAPDKLAADLVAEEHVLGGDDRFMVRGAFPEPDGPFMLPVSARH